MEDFKFTPEDGFRNTTSFPNPANGTETRNQLQTPLDQLKTYINDNATRYNGTVVRLRLGTNKELQFSTDGTNWLTLPMMDFDVIEEVD